jgi:hypothetical protein
MFVQSRKIFSTFFFNNNFVEKNVLVLGRWSVVNKYSIVNKKIDFSNTDNCFYGANKETKMDSEKEAKMDSEKEAKMDSEKETKMDSEIKKVTENKDKELELNLIIGIICYSDCMDLKK